MAAWSFSSDMLRGCPQRDHASDPLAAPRRSIPDQIPVALVSAVAGAHQHCNLGGFVDATFELGERLQSLRISER